MARAQTPAQRKRQQLPAVPVVEADDDTFAAPADKPLHKPTANVNGVSGERLLAFIQRIERLKSEIRSLQDDVKEIKAEAKGSGYDVKIVNHLIKLRAQDKDDLDEFDTLVDIYKAAIGME